jgi:SAM-dependent methyltransferase
VAHLARYQFASKQFDSHRGERILDVACGLGYGSEILLNESYSTYMGIDIDGTAVQYAQRNYQDESRNYLLGNGPKLPLRDGAIEYVTSFETMEHINTDTKFLKELNRVTTDTASLLISVPYNESEETIRGDWNRSKDYPHVNIYTFEGFKSKIQETFSNDTVDVYEQKEPTSVLSFDLPPNVRQSISTHLPTLFKKRENSDRIQENSPALVALIHP